MEIDYVLCRRDHMDRVMPVGGAMWEWHTNRQHMRHM